MKHSFFTKMLITLLLTAVFGLSAPTPVMASDFGGLAVFLVGHFLTFLIVLFYTFYIAFKLLKDSYQSRTELVISFVYTTIASILVVCSLAPHWGSLIAGFTRSIDLIWIMIFGKPLLILFDWLAPIFQYQRFQHEKKEE